MNNIIISGRLSTDPEIKTSKSGTTVASFTVAVDRKTKDRQADFFRCVAFDKTADNIERFFGKGNRIILRGSMQSDQYEKNGQKLTSWSMVVNEFDFCDSSRSEPTKPAADNAPVDTDDDFPF